MSTKKVCLECLSGLDKAGQEQLIAEGAHMKTLAYFTYAEHLCNGCVEYLSTRGAYSGAPKESFNYYHFFMNHFQWLYAKIRKEMDKDQDTIDRYNFALDKKKVYIKQAMINIHNKPHEQIAPIVNHLISQIYKYVTNREFTIKEINHKLEWKRR